MNLNNKKEGDASFMDEKFYDIKDISKYLKLSISYIRQLVRSGCIPYYRFGNRLRFKLSDINNWVENNKTKERKNPFI